MTTVSKPKSRPPNAPVNVAFINLEFGRNLHLFLSESLSLCSECILLRLREKI